MTRIANASPSYSRLGGSITTTNRSRRSNYPSPSGALSIQLNRGRQFVATALGKMAGTRAAGFVLVRQEAAGKWGAASYALCRTTSDADDSAQHRDHRGQGVGDQTPADPM